MCNLPGIVVDAEDTVPNQTQLAIKFASKDEV